MIHFWAISRCLSTWHFWLANVYLFVPPANGYFLWLQVCERKSILLKLSLLSLSIFHQHVHQPVQGFDYAKQHLGQQGGDEETLPVSQDTLVMSLQIRDTPLSLEKALQQDGTASKKSLTSDKHKRYHYIFSSCCKTVEKTFWTFRQFLYVRDNRPNWISNIILLL